MQLRRLLTLVLFASWGSIAMQASAQVAQADYTRASEIGKKYSELVVNMPETPVWIDGTETFIYRKTVEGGHEFVLVDAANQTKKAPFDHAKLAAALGKASGKEYKAEKLPFARFKLVDTQAAIEFVLENARWHCDLATYVCSNHGALRPEDEEYDSDDDYENIPKAANSDTKVETSPDGKWQAYVVNYNIAVRPKDSKDNSQQTMLSTDGSEGNYYARSTIVWSPDSKHLVAYRILPGHHRVIHYIESSPANQLQPMSIPRPAMCSTLSSQFFSTLRQSANTPSAMSYSPTHSRFQARPGGRTAEASPFNTISAGIRSFASSKWTPPPAKPEA